MSAARWALSHSSDPIQTAHAHETLKADSALWDRLAFAGFLDGVDAVYEQRICPACETALSIPADAGRILRVHAAVVRIAASSLEAVLGAQTRSPLPVRLVPSDRRDDHGATVPYPIAIDETIRHTSATEVARHPLAAASVTA